MINNFVGVGHLTGNAELKYTTSNIACLKFSICINKSYKKEDKWINKANFLDCIVWGRYGESMHKHLTKGRQIGVIGELDQNLWTDNSGEKHNNINIIVNSISLMAQPKNKNAEGGNTGGHEPTPERESYGRADDLPDNSPF